MNGQDLEMAQQKAYKSMEESNKNALEKDKEKAGYDEKYEVALQKEMLVLRTDGNPVSMVEKLAKGKPEIAHLKFLSAVAEAEARASKENINIKKKIFDSLENTKKRELG